MCAFWTHHVHSHKFRKTNWRSKVVENSSRTSEHPSALCRIVWRIWMARLTAWWPATPLTPHRLRTSAMLSMGASPRSRAWLLVVVPNSTSRTACISSSETWMMKSLGSSKPVPSQIMLLSARESAVKGWNDLFRFNIFFMTKQLKIKHISIPTPHREKKLLVSSEDYGRDLTGVQNLRKKHKRLEAELGAHEPAIQVRGSSIYLISFYTRCKLFLANLYRPQSLCKLFLVNLSRPQSLCKVGSVPCCLLWPTKGW